jgi:hypothetical protein
MPVASTPPPHVKINEKEVRLEYIGPSKGGTKRYRAMAHVKGLGTVYVTAYIGTVTPSISPANTVEEMTTLIKSLNTRLSSLEHQVEVDQKGSRSESGGFGYKPPPPSA